MAMVRSSVVLPQPLGPIIATCCPFSTLKETSSMEYHPDYWGGWSTAERKAQSWGTLEFY